MSTRNDPGGSFLSSRSAPSSSGKSSQTAEDARRRCDFCGDRVASVRRVALDREYDRLQKAHQERYACAPCFEKKEQARLGLLRG